MKVKYLFLAIILLIGLNACSNEHSVVLHNDDETVYETYSGVESKSVIELPVLEEEGQIFVGWSDGDLIYNNNIMVRQNLDLTAVFENPSEVFEYNLNSEDNEAYITNYTGNAKYLKIPVRIEGMVVKSIQTRAFENSLLIEVEIPKSLEYIGPQAFKGSNDLQRISFYGDYFGEKDLVFNHYQYDELMEEYEDVCTLTENDEDSWHFSQGCPIKSVNDVEFMEVNGIELTSYHVTVDLSYYENMLGFVIHGHAFSDMESLTTVEFPERYQVFHPSIFNNTPSLVNLVFEGNENFQVIDNIVYSPNKEELIYYPPGLEYEDFEVPDFVRKIRFGAFNDNFYLKTINIHENIEEIRFGAFSNMHLFQAIHVDSNNDHFHSVDGVLYTFDHTLLAYPCAKLDPEFIMPESTRSVAPYAFYRQKHLESISLSSNLEHLGNEAFMYVEKLEILDVPSSVTHFGYDLTRRSSIHTIIIRRSLVEDGGLPGPTQHPYPDYPNIYVPDDAYDAYLSEFNWQPVGNYIHPISELETE